MVKNEVGGACSTYGGGEKCIQDFGGEKGNDALSKFCFVSQRITKVYV